VRIVKESQSEFPREPIPAFVVGLVDVWNDSHARLPTPADAFGM
jgi:hypothetical protein